MSEETEDIRVKLKPLFKKHDYNKSYNVLTIVTHTIDGELSFYQAIRNVPKFISITDKSYWRLITSSIGDYVDDNEPDIPVEPIEPEEPEEPIDTTDYLKVKAQNNLEFYITRLDNTTSIAYSLNNGIAWNTYNFENNEIITIPINDIVLFRGVNTDLCNVRFNTNNLDNPNVDAIITVTGDIQTLFYSETYIGRVESLFKNVVLSSDTNIICSASLFTAACFKDMFEDQILLKNPMELPNIDNNSFRLIEGDNLGSDYKSPFANMYKNCTSLIKMFDISNIVINEETSENTITTILNSFYNCLIGTNFNITNDSGETLSFNCGVELEDLDSKIAFCRHLGNVNGFPEDPFAVVITVYKDTSGYTNIINLDTNETASTQGLTNGEYISNTYYGNKNSLTGKVNIKLTAVCTSSIRTFDNWMYIDDQNSWHEYANRNNPWIITFIGDGSVTTKPYFTT